MMVVVVVMIMMVVVVVMIIMMLLLLIKMAVVVKAMATIMMMMMVSPGELFAIMVMMVMFHGLNSKYMHTMLVLSIMIMTISELLFRYVEENNLKAPFIMTCCGSLTKATLRCQ